MRMYVCQSVYCDVLVPQSQANPPLQAIFPVHFTNCIIKNESMQALAQFEVA